MQPKAIIAYPQITSCAYEGLKMYVMNPSYPYGVKGYSYKFLYPISKVLHILLIRTN